jgi:hypothetical protein
MVYYLEYKKPKGMGAKNNPYVDLIVKNLTNKKVLDDYIARGHFVDYMNKYLDDGLPEVFSEFNKLEGNVFISEESKTTIINFLYIQIRFRYLLKKYLLKNIFEKRVSKYKKPIETDMLLNDLSTYPESNIIHLTDSENLNIWDFYDRDLIKIISSSLLNQEDKIPVVMTPKNPYTNTRFTKNQLYLIYSKFKDIRLPIHMILYYRYDFNIQKLMTFHWDYFVKMSCTNYVKNLSRGEFLVELKSILSEYAKTRNYVWGAIVCNKKIKEEFEDIVIRITLAEHFEIFHHKLIKLKKEFGIMISNPKYGRKILKINNRRFKKIYKFKTDHNKKLENSSYMENGIFTFGGNQNYKDAEKIVNEVVEKALEQVTIKRECKRALDNIIDIIEDKSFYESRWLNITQESLIDTFLIRTLQGNEVYYDEEEKAIDETEGEVIKILDEIINDVENYKNKEGVQCNKVIDEKDKPTVELETGEIIVYNRHHKKKKRIRVDKDDTQENTQQYIKEDSFNTYIQNNNSIHFTIGSKPPKKKKYLKNK